AGEPARPPDPDRGPYGVVPGRRLHSLARAGGFLRRQSAAGVLILARWFITLLAALALAGCGGGGGSSSGGSTTPAPLPAPVPIPTPMPVANTAAITIDAGPAALQAANSS